MTCHQTSMNNFNASWAVLQERYAINLYLFLVLVSPLTIHVVLNFSHKVTQDKLNNGDCLNKGKKKMGYNVYKLMCQILLQGDSTEYCFAHLFLTLEWNLMS